MKCSTSKVVDHIPKLYISGGDIRQPVRSFIVRKSSTKPILISFIGKAYLGKAMDIFPIIFCRWITKHVYGLILWM